MAQRVNAYVLRRRDGALFVYVPDPHNIGQFPDALQSQLVPGLNYDAMHPVQNIGPASIYPCDSSPRIDLRLNGDAEHAIRTNRWVPGGRFGLILVQRLLLPPIVQQAISGVRPKEGHGRQVQLFTQQWLERILRE